MNKCLGGLLCLLLLVACEKQSPLAPVEERSHASVALPNQYRVRTGDTLYSVAWAYHLDYRQLAAINHLQKPYTIHLGQVLSVKPGVAPSEVVTPQEPVRPVSGKSITHWQWPTRGKVVENFSNKPLGNHGLDIAGQLQRPIYASAAGVVVYSGQGIRGYGKLLIIKHNEHYLSAYAFNWRNLVKEGDTVAAGQQIASMGRDDSGQVLLHFEIRYNGKPVDPRHYLTS